MLEGKGSRDESVRQAAHHDQFLELCALAASGSLNEAEAKKLREHLAVCRECREAIREFNAAVDGLIPELAGEGRGEPSFDPAFRLETAEACFQKRLAEEKGRERSAAEAISPVGGRGRFLRRPLRGYEIWIPLLTSAVLCATFGILSYRTGRNHGLEWARLEQRSTPAAEAALVAHAPAQSHADLQNTEGTSRDAMLAALRREIAQKTSELERLKALDASQQAALRANANEKNSVAEERDRLQQQVSANEEALRTTRERLNNLERERSESVIHAASLEASMADLTRSLRERDRLTSEQQDLLAKDRDIRELMGARDLVITEVYDVARTGKTEKAFGRVFFTKGKSLVFYAYDLNDESGLREASAYQAWGSRGADQAQAFNLGMFYEDNVAKKRWVLKFNDKKKLDQIDTVFVTVEPHGGSERPTGKPLLYAYLKVAPNHP